MSKPLRRAIVKTNSFAFDSHHLFSVLLAIVCVVVPIVEKWVGPFSWKMLLSIVPGALVSFWMLLQKSPRDLAAYLETIKPTLERKAPEVVIVEVKSDKEDGGNDGSTDKAV